MIKKSVRLTAVLLAGLLVLGLVNMTALEVQAETYGENVLLNPDFTDEDLSMWGVEQGKATITAVDNESEIYNGVTTYGMISNRTTPYECFAQDITNLVENGKKYEFTFYAKLSEQYEGAPAEQRELNFAPYVTVDGSTTYLGSYSAELTGTVTQTLTPGEWTKFNGTFSIDFKGNIDQIVIRLLEQGTNYGQGNCVLGDFYVTGVSLREIMPDPVILEDVTPVKDAIAGAMGENFLVGGAATVKELEDMGVEAILRKHFNALSIGNELKPDALFGYSNNKCPGTTTDVLNGETITVPVLDFSRAEKILDKVKKWNKADPENQIKMRGHVLVWHAQTPEWFFHEDYDASKPYVTKEEMNKRLEWFIKSVLEHFTGEGSEYQGMFYGWDVVNEAVSDSGGKYRNDKEKSSESLSQSTHGSNSSWWHVYGSEEYIVNAFIYANKYAPADVELYYNDYSAFDSTKMIGILNLLNAVKSAEGARIDGMGMQGHYGVGYPNLEKFETAMKAYAEAVGSVQITEWDIKASTRYDGTDKTRKEEYVRIANQYKDLYNSILKLKGEGVNITGLTFWGVIDKHSWLQTSSNVGGAADGKQKQCPLLFDDNYNVKPAYWAFVDQSMIATNGKPAEEPTPEKESEVVEESQVTEESKVTEESQTTTESQVTQEKNDKDDDITIDKKSDISPLTIILIVVGVVVVAGVVIFFVMSNRAVKSSEENEDNGNEEE